MQMKKTIISFIFLGVLNFVLISFLKAEAGIVDHGKDRYKAKEWAKENYQSWKEKLTKEEKESLALLLEPIDIRDEINNLDNINHQLKVYGGDLTARPVDTEEQNKILSDHVERLSRIVNRKEGKLLEPLIVYKTEPMENVINIKDQYFKNADGSLKMETLKQLRTDFSFSQHSEFRIYDLYEDVKQKGMVRWKITLPSLTSTGLIDKNRIFIDKNSDVKIKNIKIIVQKGKQYVRVEADLVPKSTVEDEIKQLTDKITHDFTTKLRLPTNKKFLDLILSGSSSHFIAKKLEEFLHKFTTLISPNLIQATLKFMSKKEGYLILTDRELYTLPKIYEPYPRTLEEVVKMMNSVGNFTSGGNHTLSVHLPEGLQNSNEIDTQVLFHEFGHAVDQYGAEILEKKEKELSASSEFNQIFKKEGENLTPYGSLDPSEFFAEAFWMSHSEEKNLVEEKAPEAYTYIQKNLALIEKREKLFNIK